MQAITIAILAASIILAVCVGHKKDARSRHPAARQGIPRPSSSRNEHVSAVAAGHASGANPSRLSPVHSHRSPSRSRAEGMPGNPLCPRGAEVNSRRGQSRGDVLEPPKIHYASVNCTKILELATRCSEYSSGPFIYKFGSGPSPNQIDLCYKRNAGSMIKTATIWIQGSEMGYSYIRPVPRPTKGTSLSFLRDNLLAGINHIYNDTHERLIPILRNRMDAGIFQHLGITVSFISIKFDRAYAGSSKVEVAQITKDQGTQVLESAASYGYHTGDYFFISDPDIPEDVVLFCLGEDNEPLVATILISQHNSNIEYTGPGSALAQFGSLVELTDTFVSQKGYIYDKDGGILQPKIYYPG